jgi:uncharacterized protein YlbG (UPF0298 family)
LKGTNALLDTKTNEVICQECNKPIDNISEPMKRSLKSFGQIVRVSAKKAFMVLCRQCNANREIVLNKNGTTTCKDCHSAVAVPAAFKQALKEADQKLKEALEVNPQETDE